MGRRPDRVRDQLFGREQLVAAAGRKWRDEREHGEAQECGRPKDRDVEGSGAWRQLTGDDGGTQQARHARGQYEQPDADAFRPDHLPPQPNEGGQLHACHRSRSVMRVVPS